LTVITFSLSGAIIGISRDIPVGSTLSRQSSSATKENCRAWTCARRRSFLTFDYNHSIFGKSRPQRNPATHSPRDAVAIKSGDGIIAGSQALASAFELS
jgi:hypothetical protein